MMWIAWTEFANSQTVQCNAWYLYFRMGFRRLSKNRSASNNWNWLCNRITIDYCVNWIDDAMHNKNIISKSQPLEAMNAQNVYPPLHRTYPMTRFNSMIPHNTAAVYFKKNEAKKKPTQYRKLSSQIKSFSSKLIFLVFLSSFLGTSQRNWWNMTK